MFKLTAGSCRMPLDVVVVVVVVVVEVADVANEVGVDVAPVVLVASWQLMPAIARVLI